MPALQAAVTGGCAVIHPYAAIICGTMAGIIFIYSDHFILHRLKVDDVVAACSMHMCCGMLGLIFIGFFAVPEFVQQLYGPSSLRRAGIFYGGTGHLLACQVGPAAHGSSTSPHPSGLALEQS